MFYIYCIRNTNDGKVYVGQSVNYKHRFLSHKSLLRNNKHENAHLQRSWDLYGSESFECFILDSCDSLEEVNRLEKLYVSWYKAVGMSYNIKGGGDGVGTMAQESKDKIGAKRRGKVNSSETRKRIADALRGKPGVRKGMKHTEEFKKRMSEIKKGQPNGCLGHRHTEETKRKISESKKGTRAWNKGISATSINKSNTENININDINGDITSGI